MAEPQEWENIKAELQALESKIEKGLLDFSNQLAADSTRLRADIQDERVRRAERYAEYMRNWLALCTFAVTIVLVGAGLLGIRSYSEIEGYRKQMREDSEALLRKANEALAEVSRKKNDVEEIRANFAARYNEVLSRASDVSQKQRQIDELRAKFATQYNEIESQSDVLKKRVQEAEKVAGEAGIRAANTQSALSSLGSGGPVIFSGPLGAGVSQLSSIVGINFGPRPGHLYARVEQPWGTSDRIEIEPSLTMKWSDSAIGFVLSPANRDALLKARNSLDAKAPTGVMGSSLGPNLAFQVETAQGQVSNWASSVFWPLGPW
jgi:hypothetical protein